MNVSVILPYRAGCPHRDMAFDWVSAWWAGEFPECELIVGESPDGPFNRAAALIDGASKASGEVFVFADADVWIEPAAIVEAVTACVDTGWAVPHLLLHRLSSDSTDLFMAGHPLEGLELSDANERDSRPYVGNECGTLVAVRADVFWDVIPDPRFVGWGHEDDAWAVALRALIGKPWRGDADLVHLWHPEPVRMDRRNGSVAGRELENTYRVFRHNPVAIRRLIDEAKEVAHVHVGSH